MKRSFSPFRLFGALSAIVFAISLPVIAGAQPSATPPAGNVDAAFNSVSLGSTTLEPQSGDLVFGSGGGIKGDDTGTPVDDDTLWTDCGSLGLGAYWPDPINNPLQINCQESPTIFSSLNLQGTITSALGLIPFMGEEIVLFGDNGAGGNGIVGLGADGTIRGEGVGLRLTTFTDLILDAGTVLIPDEMLFFRSTPNNTYSLGFGNVQSTGQGMVVSSDDYIEFRESDTGTARATWSMNSANFDFKGHVSADSIGGSYLVNGPYYSVSPGSVRSIVTYCNEPTHIAMNCGWQTSPVLSSDFWPYYNVGVASYCNSFFRNTGSGTTSVRSRITCFDPSS